METLTKPNRGKDFDPAEDLNNHLDSQDVYDSELDQILYGQSYVRSRDDHAAFEREQRERLSYRRKHPLAMKAASALTALAIGAGIASSHSPEKDMNGEFMLRAPAVEVTYIPSEAAVEVMGMQFEAPAEKVESNSELSVTHVFEDGRAEQAMIKFGMDARDFFIPRPEVMDKIAEESHWAENDQLLPGYIPAIYEHEMTILEAADQHNVSPNVVAIFLEIESHGFEGAENHIPALGLGQHTSWMIDNYKLLGYMPESASREDFLAAWNSQESNLDKEFYRSTMMNPDYNIQVTALHLSQLQKKVVNDNPEMNVNDPRLYAEMGLIYNGGYKQYNAGEPNRAFESRNYADSIELLALQNAVADELNRQGLSDEEGESALTDLSDEFFAALYAVRYSEVNMTDNTDVRLEKLGDIVAFMEGEERESVAKAVETYQAGDAHLRDFTQPYATYHGEFQEFFGPGYWAVAQRSGNGLYHQAHSGS